MIARVLVKVPCRWLAKQKQPHQMKEVILRANPDQVKKAEKIVSRMTQSNLPTLPESADTIMNVESLTVTRAMRIIDTNFETFFENRPVDTKNFTLLIKAAGEQRNASAVVNSLEKMRLLGLQVTETVTAVVVNSLVKCRKFDEALKIFEEGVEKFGPSVTLYTAGLNLAGKSHNFPLAQNIWKRGTEVERLKPNLELLTAMVSACLACHQIKECWVRFEEAEKLEITPDDVLLGLMIRICAKSHSAEKAKLLWTKIKKLPNVRFTALHYDAIITALASRADYAEEALAMYHEMKDSLIQPDRMTFVGVLEATAKLGDITTAYNAIVQMNALKIPQNDQIFDGLLKTYAGALAKENVPKELKELYLKDSWKLFDSIVEKSPEVLTASILNSLALVHIKADKLEEAQDAVLPLFDKFGIQKTGDTYKVFIQGLFDKRQLVKVRNVFDNLVKTDTQLLNVDSLNTCLDTFIRIRDTPRLQQSLDLFLEKKKTPEWKLMRYLARMASLPDEIYDRLRKFKFGDVILREKLRTYKPLSDVEKELLTPKERDRNRLTRRPLKKDKVIPDRRESFKD